MSIASEAEGPSLDAHHVIASSTGSRVLFGAMHSDVAIGDLESGTLSEKIQTTFDAGGRRLALSDQLNGILAGAYHVHGLAFYRCGTGHEVWRLKDIKKIQVATLSHDGRVAYCGRQGLPLIVINLEKGKIVANHVSRSIRAVRSWQDSPFDQASFADGAIPHVLVKDRRHSIRRTTFAFLSAAFAPGLLGLSEAGGPVRCFDIRDGSEKWRYRSPGSDHVVRLAYREKPAAFVGIEWPLRGDRSPQRLLQFSLEDGRVTEVFDIGNPIGACFARSGLVVVTTAGDVIDTCTGATRMVFGGLSRGRTLAI
jgi:hypothetical protein